MRPGSQFTPKAIQVFKSFATAAPAVMEVGTQSGIPKDLIGGAIGQLCNEEGDATSNGGVPFKAAEIRLYSPPPLKNSKAQVMLLFRGTKFVTVEESIGAGPEGTILFFSSSLLVALPYGVLQEGESNAFRITLCRVERRSDSAILDKSHLPDKELAILEKHANDVEKLKASVSQWPHEGSDNTVYDGTMEYGDYGMVYCFNTNYVGVSTLLSADVQWGETVLTHSSEGKRV
ncbi:hypothetical protein, conserved [Trypanosoma brucei gambiense DAL972]|uniref:Uncharacterized protein n=1 Tax=Trypanosoma brucei gambiense (strain MHOM/CI/86/DAL972) TaxID=679716 RepID=C9ZMS7_TRYB9|nr:hypothetical protein, conserved [Trypanosoma brucei gambiense DAL972]CBH10580.1 hypothetical protein, conserved [Trypanosoma brucei gambiense DAL972]|eukprot:XP_011772869.1 hypothetical protein, conserved [Trypanosoma brucei gambiense DAL972]